jgi:hypothetical protein
MFILRFAPFFRCYTSHASPSYRRRLLGSVQATLEAYKSAFLIQAASAIVENVSLRDVNTDKLFRKILIDATGFLGLQGLSFLATQHRDRDHFSLSELKEMNWGDKKGWALAIRRRQARLYVRALEQYCSGINDAEKKDPSLLDWGSVILSLFLADDISLTSEHKTEYWDP